MSPSRENPVVLSVDDDDVFRNRLCRAFRQRGWEAHEAGDGDRAIEVAREVSPDLILVDLRMPGASGLDIIKELRELDPTTIVIMLTGFGSIPTALAAVKLGADHYLSKPVDVDQILGAYENLRSQEPSEALPPANVPSLARVEWEHIQRVLTDCSGNISQAAKLLGIHRRSLQRKLSKYPPMR
ncbi:MAG: response regulator transcription factor [Bryobacteraceae bacterium]